jgi:hypothetical protein
VYRYFRTGHYNTKKLLAGVIQDFISEHKESLTSNCGLLGKSNQLYYRIQKSEQRRRLVSEKVVGLASLIRKEKRREKKRKLHFMLSTELASIGVGMDRFYTY